MAHQYLRPVPVVVRDGLPTSFRWHGEEYTVAEVLATWHLQDRRWASPTETAFDRAEADRTYYRVRCPDQQVFDLFRDAVSGLWVLDRAQDERRRVHGGCRVGGDGARLSAVGCRAAGAGARTGGALMGEV